ncbi:unnamed protein product [Mycena citricolor]|uniref:Major facilitator superfamily (MFS) profile domain-containing protein n=1 Tax=Mycena citricolor TaxID=2018698 RepID=A0AAD2HVK1_9AGAR|nr:unnamed protein product [Mycena citricolor]
MVEMDADNLSAGTGGTNPEMTTRRLNGMRIIALQEVDSADLMSFHFKVCIVAGIGFFTDAYDIFSINIAATMIGYVYGTVSDSKCHPTLTDRQSFGLKIATPVGTFFGQLLFGWLADVFGRRKMYGVELIIVIIGTFAQATAGGGQAINILAMLIFWRFVVGIGIGGDYPLSATIASEFAATRIRGRMMTAVFAAQGWGTLAASITATVITTAFKSQIEADYAGCTCSTAALCAAVRSPNHIDYAWRLLIGLGCVPAAMALWFRITIPETQRFTMDVQRNMVRAAEDIQGALHAGQRYRQGEAHLGEEMTVRARAPRRETFKFFGRWENLKVLIGTTWSWFAIDVSYYTLGLNSTAILQAIKFRASDSIYGNLHNLCVGNIILGLAGLIPGYWACFLLIDKWGRKPIQFMGFGILAVIFSVMGFSFNSLVPDSQSSNGPKTNFFFFLFCLANFFQNFGPNTTTFVIPGEIFPTRYRSTGHGISAAGGKLGAIVAQGMFNGLVHPDKSDHWLDHSFEILALFMITGLASTWLVPETMGKSLEVLSKEDQEDFMQAPEHGGEEIVNGVVIAMPNLRR